MNDKDLIVVGVDGTDGSRHALRWAIDEARRSGCAVEAVTAWTFEGGVVAVATPLEQQQQAERLSEHEVGAVARDVALTRKVIEGYAVDVLSETARDARLLVLGGHGHGRLRNAVLGSTLDAIVRHAVCPVVIVPAPHPAAVATTPEVAATAG